MLHLIFTSTVHVLIIIGSSSGNIFSQKSIISSYFTDGDKHLKEFMERNYPKNFPYANFAKDFTAEFFNATEWAEIFVKSGAK